jgi:hypothetical protein
MKSILKLSNWKLHVGGHHSRPIVSCILCAEPDDRPIKSCSTKNCMWAPSLIQPTDALQPGVVRIWKRRLCLTQHHFHYRCHYRRFLDGNYASPHLSTATDRHSSEERRKTPNYESALGQHSQCAFLFQKLITFLTVMLPFTTPPYNLFHL